MKKNITIICLSNKYKKIVAKELADSLEMFYADINDIMEYNLINSEMLLSAGQQYFDENVTNRRPVTLAANLVKYLDDLSEEDKEKVLQFAQTTAALNSEDK